MKLLSRLIVRYSPRLLALETSLGHSLWAPHLATLPPIRVKEIKPSVGKELCAAQALGLYEAVPNQVIHHPSLKGGELEQQLLAFPTASVHDDLVDALSQALILFEQAHHKRPAPKPRQLS
jgi:phage terminase large subunit-like protein